jgi:DNA-binding NarL/FixJ family response regulator
MLSVVLVDDHAALREGLEVLLEPRGVQVLAAVGGAADAIAALSDCDPDVAVIDLQLPDGSGLRLVRRVREEKPKVKTLIYTGSQDSQTLADALETGAEGIVLKPGNVKTLVDALRAVTRGNRHVDPAIAEILKAAGEDERLLTGREREVFALLADGLSGEEIAMRLALSAETVRTHIRNGMGRLNARTRTEAVVKAFRDGEL